MGVAIWCMISWSTTLRMWPPSRPDGVGVNLSHQNFKNEIFICNFIMQV